MKFRKKPRRKRETCPKFVPKEKREKARHPKGPQRAVTAKPPTQAPHKKPRPNPRR